MSISHDNVASQIGDLVKEVKALRQGWHEINPAGRRDLPTHHDLHKLRCELMSIVSEQSSRLDGFVANVREKVKRVKEEVEKLKQQLADQDNNPGPISGEDQALLTASVNSVGSIEGDMDGLVELLSRPPVIDNPEDPNDPQTLNQRGLLNRSIDPNNPNAFPGDPTDRLKFDPHRFQGDPDVTQTDRRLRDLPGSPNANDEALKRRQDGAVQRAQDRADAVRREGGLPRAVDERSAATRAKDAAEMNRPNT